MIRLPNPSLQPTCYGLRPSHAAELQRRALKPMAAFPERQVTLAWRRYETFFDLWRARREDTQLIYVIGPDHHCYIGSIGSRGGKQGLGTRYQWQYVQRARAIFGLDENAGRPAFAAAFSVDTAPTGDDILAAEAYVQNQFIVNVGPDHALFEPEDIVEGFVFVNSGDVPPFIHAAP